MKLSAQYTNRQMTLLIDDKVDEEQTFDDWLCFRKCLNLIGVVEGEIVDQICSDLRKNEGKWLEWTF